MKIKHQLSIATLLMAGVFVTGCSQQSMDGGSQVAGGSQSQIEGGSQVSGSQQQVEEAAPVVTAAPVRRRAPAPVRRAPVRRHNPWLHTHPAIPRCTKSVRHSHKYNKRMARHSHKYSCNRPARRVHHAKRVAPPVDVYALQRKLKAKGYYKGPIDGVVGPGTRSALQRFMKR
jgi:hypothetical protein